MLKTKKHLRRLVEIMLPGLAGAAILTTAFALMQPPPRTAVAQAGAPPGPTASPGLTSTLTQTVIARLTALFEPSAGRAVSARAPVSATLASVSVAADEVTVVLDIPEAVLYNAADLIDSDEVNRAVGYSLEGLPFTTIRVLAVDPRNRQAAPKLLHEFIPTRPMQYKPSTSATLLQGQAASSAVAASAAIGALSGKSVYVSAGHGWYWHPDLGWNTQRPVYNGLIEDFNNAEAVNQYLIAYLRQAGADVFPARDHTMLTAEVRVDNSNAGYSEAGTWQTDCPAQYPGKVDGCLRYTTTTNVQNPTASATWRAVMPVSGDYPVYAWYNAQSNRTGQARYRIQHAAGTREVIINQKIHGYTWRYLGTFPFRAGEEARVTLLNTASTPGEILVADAIRFGGGIGDVDRGGGASGKPRFEEAARYWAMLQGAPASVYDPVTNGYDNTDDVTARPRYADWENYGTGDDAVFVSWHTNGFNGTARGTVSYVYLTPTQSSLALQGAVHVAVVGAIKSGWDSTWLDRGAQRMDLGEVRVAQTMPSMLIEMAFHDNPIDAAALREPYFEQLLARSMYQGIVNYYAQKGGIAPRYLPEPPQRFVMRNVGNGQVLFSWQPPPTFAFGSATHAAQRYRVYLSNDGFAWDEGHDASGTSLVLSGFAPGQVVYARVTAVNDGGESFPTPVLAARVGNAPRALIVQGFDSLGASMRQVQTVGNNVGVTRMLLDRMNRYNYIVQHAGALTEPFDSAVHQAIPAGDLALTNYLLVDWFMGGQRVEDGVLSANERQALRTFVAAGKRVLSLSGAHVAGYLASADADFLNNTLRAVWLGVATSNAVNAVSGELFAGTPAFSIDDGSGSTYDARGSDMIAPLSGAATALRYSDGNAAGISALHANGSRVVYIAFPFETARSTDAQSTLMARVLSLLPPREVNFVHKSFLPLVNQATCSALIANSGFEDNTAWQINMTPFPAAYSTAKAHTGARSMQAGVPLGQTGVLTAFSSVSQTVTLPNITPLTLTMWRHSTSQDTDDQFYVALWGRGDLNRVSSPSNRWEQLTFDLSPYAGQTITLLLGAYNDPDDLKSVAYYDDVTIQCGL